MIAVIGCGNLNRSDDAAGVEAVRLVRARFADAGDDLRFLDAGTDGMAVMFAARGARALIIIDACASGAAPGTIFRAPGAELAARHAPALNLHDFRWDHALHAGRQIFGADFPSDVEVFLIEARGTEFGLGLSPEVAAATARVADLIAEAIKERRERHLGAGAAT
jgi:hydrogenase maturation protease